MIAPANVARLPRVFPRLGAIARPWRTPLLLVGALVILAAVVQLAPPLIVRSIVDDHLAANRADGLLLLAVLYLGAVAGGQGLIFTYTYLAASIARRAERAPGAPFLTPSQPAGGVLRPDISRRCDQPLYRRC